MDQQAALLPRDLVRHAEELDLDGDRFATDLRRHAGAARVARDVESARESGVAGTPTFFINGRRQYGAYDLDTLTAALQQAKARAAVEASGPLPQTRRVTGGGG